jgi:hypothetical protein
MAMMMLRSGKMQPSEAAKLREAAHQDSPLVRALAGVGEVFLEKTGILAALPEGWEPQTGIIHSGRKGEDVDVSGVNVSSSNQEETDRDLAGCVGVLAELLRETGEEGAGLAAGLAEVDAATLWAPLPEVDLVGELEGARRVPLGAVHIGDGGPPIRVFGPDSATCKALRLLVLAVWRDRFGGAVLVRWPSPTIPSGLVRRVLEPMREGTLAEEEEGLVLRDGKALVGRFPSLDSESVARILERPDLFRSVAFARLILALPWWTWNQAIQGVNPYTRLEFTGLTSFGAALGISDRTEVAGLPDLLLAGQEYRGARLDLAPLWMAYLPTGGKMGRGRHPATVRIDVGEALAPYGYDQFARGEDRRLLPVLPAPCLEPVNRRRRAPALFLQFAFLWELRDSVARGNTRNGAIELTYRQMERAADRSGVTRSELTALVSVWIGEPESGAWLVREEGDLVRVADSGAHEVLIGAAERAVRNRVRYKRKG